MTKRKVKTAKPRRPYRRESKYGARTSFALEPAMLDAVHAIADENEKSPAAVLRECVRAGLPVVKRRAAQTEPQP